MFDGLKTFIKERQIKEEERKAKDHEYERALEEATHKARMENIPNIAKIEIEEDMKAKKSGKSKKGGGIGDAIQNYAANFENTPYMKSMGGGKGKSKGDSGFEMPTFEMPAMDFGFGAPSKARRTAKKSHKKSKRR